MQAIVQKLPTYAQNKWRSAAPTMRRTEQRFPAFTNLVRFTEQEVDIANYPVYRKQGSG